jgi:hypothetical protein
MDATPGGAVWRANVGGRLSVSAALALLIATLVFVAPAQASSIFFLRSDNIWVANPDGSDAQQVTSDGSAADPYNFISSAKEGSAPLLAFHRGTEGASNGEYGTINPNGTGETANPYNKEMVDDEQFFTRIDNAGNRVTWAAKQNTDAQSFFASSVGVEGGSPQGLYNLGGMDARDVTFGEPSGASLLFTDTGGNYYFNGNVEEDPCEDSDIYLPILVRQTPGPSGSNTGASEPVLYCDTSTQFYDPALSPNGQLIAAQAESNQVGSSGQVVTIPIGGNVSTPHMVSPMTQITPANSGDSLPDFSPDSSQIVYQGPGETIYTVPAAGGTPTQILTSASVPAWSSYALPTGTSSGPGPGIVPGNTLLVPPSFKSLSLKTRTIHARAGLTLKIALSGAGTVVVELELVGHHHKLKLVGTVKLTGKAGANSFTIKRVHGHTLAPGSYKLVLYTENGSSKSTTRTLSLTVKR